MKNADLHAPKVSVFRFVSIHYFEHNSFNCAHVKVCSDGRMWADLQANFTLNQRSAYNFSHTINADCYRSHG